MPRVQWSLRLFAPFVMPMLLIPMLVIPGAFAAAPPGPAEDRSTLLKLTAHAQTEVQNDLMTVHLNIERRAEDATEAAADVNRLMRETLDRVAEVPEIDARSISYSTAPIYDRNGARERTDPWAAQDRIQPVAWQVTQVLELKGQDFDRLTTLTGELQDRGLAITQIRFSLSPEIQRLHREALVTEAIERWQRTARDMGTALGASYLLPEELTLHDDGAPGPRPMFASARHQDAVPAPALEAGQSTLRVTVSGHARAYGIPARHTLDPR